MRRKTMIKNLALLAIVLAIGFGAQMAQSDIFVRQNTKQETKQASKEDTKKTTEENNTTATGAAEKPAKPRLFLNPFAKKEGSTTKPVVITKYRPTVNTQQYQAQTQYDLKALAYWQQRKTKPQTAQEILSYASAYRAADRYRVRQARVTKLARSDALMAQRDRAREARIAANTPKQNALSDNENKSTVYTNYGNKNADSQTTTTKRIYTTKQDRLETPKRVFTNYR